MKKSFIILVILAISEIAYAGLHYVGGIPDNANCIPFCTGSSQMRWQTLWYKSELGQGGKITKIEWQTWDNGSINGGKYIGCKILLCHTSKTTVSATFADNYGGNTPVTVFSGTYVLPASPASQWISIVEPTNFTYNNNDNLLIEVSWTSSSGDLNYFRVRLTGSNFPGRVYNTSDANAQTGTVDTKYAHYARITLIGSNISSTSFGCVKALFK